MTIRVTIKNNGTEHQIIGVIENVVGVGPPNFNKVYLEGGEEKDFTIWDGKTLEVLELKNGKP